MGHIDECLPTSFGVEVSLINVVGKDTAHGDIFRRAGRCDGHENEQQRSYRSTLTEESDSCIWKNQTCSHICIQHARGESWEYRICFQSKSCKTHSCSGEPWDCEPAETSQYIARQSMNWTRRDSFIVVTFVRLVSFRICNFGADLPLSQKTVPKLPTILITKNMAPSFDLMVR